YDQRVLGTYVWLESALRTLGANGAALRKAIEADRARRRDPVPLDWTADSGAAPKMDFLGVESRLVDSDVAGGPVRQWTGKPIATSIPNEQGSTPKLSVSRPRAYWIPPQWSDVADRLAMHGVRMERVAEKREVDVEVYRIAGAKLATEPSEGRVP